MSFIAQRQGQTSLRDSLTTMALKCSETPNLPAEITRKGCCSGRVVHPFVLVALLASCAAKQPVPAPAAPSPAPSVSAERAAPVTSAPPVAEPSVPSVPPANGAERTDGASAATAPTASPTPEPAPGPTSTRTPSDVLTARDVAFLIDEQGSGLRAIFEAECDKTVKADDLAAKAQCVAKARDKFQPDVLRFEKDEHGKVKLSIYKRLGGTLKEAYVANVVFSDETPESVRVAISGREQGQRPLFKSGNGVVKVPNDYSIALEDPKFGELAYSAKIGLVGAK
jgi:hypothetical protein